MKSTTRIALFGAFLATGACSTAWRSTPDPFDDDPRESRQIRIEVQNDNFADATVFSLRHEGMRMRLGVVKGKSTSVFTMPWAFSEPLRFTFRLLAGPTCTTESLPVDPGDIIALQISSASDQISNWCN